MLVHGALPGVAAPNAVKAASQACLLLAIWGRDRAASCGRRLALSSRMAARGDGEMFVLPLDVDEGDASRLFTVATQKEFGRS